MQARAHAFANAVAEGLFAQGAAAFSPLLRSQINAAN